VSSGEATSAAEQERAVEASGATVEIKFMKQ
jgi:hypothetical protein